MSSVFYRLAVAATCILPFLNISNLSAQLSELSIYPGVYNSYSETAGADDFLKLAPQSVLLQDDLSGYQLSSFGSSYGNNSFALSVGMPLRKKNPENEKSRAILRLGFTYFNVSGLSANYQKQSAIRFDTLVSSQNGQLSFVDSILSQSYSMNYNAKQLRLDASVIIRWNEAARWSLYGGAGISAGVSLNASTNIAYYEYNSIGVRFPQGGVSTTYPPSLEGQDKSRSETFRNKTNFGAMLYVPLGVDFRLGNKREFWKLLHLFYELRPSADVTVVPELSSFATASFMQGIGIRAAW